MKFAAWYIEKIQDNYHAHLVACDQCANSPEETDPDGLCSQGKKLFDDLKKADVKPTVWVCKEKQPAPKPPKVRGRCSEGEREWVLKRFAAMMFGSS